MNEKIAHHPITKVFRFYNKILCFVISEFLWWRPNAVNINKEYVQSCLKTEEMDDISDATDWTRWVKFLISSCMMERLFVWKIRIGYSSVQDMFDNLAICS